MRDSLRKSIADSPVEGFERYPKGSVVICNACAKPIFKLDHAICLGDKAGQAARAFKPLALQDLTDLEAREDIDAGLRALVRSWTLEQRGAFLSTLKEMKAGDPMLCPSCLECFVQVINVDRSEVLDRSYTIELVTIPPSGKVVPIRGRQLGVTKGWVH